MANPFSFLDNLFDYDERAVAQDGVDGGVIDTARVDDSKKPYETAIGHPAYRNSDWIVVELYDTKEEAIIGHKKWVSIMQSKPSILEDVNQCDLQEFCMETIGHSFQGGYERDINYKSPEGNDV